MTTPADFVLDVAVIGAGPAGLSAGLWLRNLGISARVFERANAVGGMQRLNFLNNDWVLGLRGCTGPQLVDRFEEHARASGVEIELQTTLCRIQGRGGGFHLELLGPDRTKTASCRAVLLALGTRFRAEEVIEPAVGADVIAVLGERIRFGPYSFEGVASNRGKHVLIVGGGDNAFENAKMLAESGATFTLAVRSKPRAQHALLAAVQAHSAAGRGEIASAAVVQSMAKAGNSVTVTLMQNGRGRTVSADRVHVLAGYEPATRLFEQSPVTTEETLPSLDAEGFINIDGRCRTSVPGIYAAGDVANPMFPCVESATYQGALAARTIEGDMKAAQF